MYIGCSPHVFLVLFLSCLAAIPTTILAEEHFDVSYLWHHDLDSVKKYQEQERSKIQKPESGIIIP